jgi:hypothetical protein
VGDTCGNDSLTWAAPCTLVRFDTNETTTVADTINLMDALPAGSFDLQALEVKTIHFDLAPETGVFCATQPFLGATPKVLFFVFSIFH